MPRTRHIGDQILELVRAHSDHDPVIVTEFVVLARTISPDGKLHENHLSYWEQDPGVTRSMLTSAYVELTDE